MTAKIKMPSRQEFDAAAKKLQDAGWIRGSALMIDDAHKDGVVEFGIHWRRNDERFWLNYKTIGQLPC